MTSPLTRQHILLLNWIHSLFPHGVLVFLSAQPLAIHLCHSSSHGFLSPLHFISRLWCNFHKSISATSQPSRGSLWVTCLCLLTAHPLLKDWEVDLRLGITWSSSLICTHRKSFVHKIKPSDSAATLYQMNMLACRVHRTRLSYRTFKSHSVYW